MLSVLSGRIVAVSTVSAWQLLESLGRVGCHFSDMAARASEDFQGDSVVLRRNRTMPSLAQTLRSGRIGVDAARGNI